MKKRRRREEVGGDGSIYISREGALPEVCFPFSVRTSSSAPGFHGYLVCLPNLFPIHVLKDLWYILGSIAGQPLRNQCRTTIN